ncbi:MAG: regulatory iron-sulfur-containing complex subunit RicT [Gemmatimonadota bacterium]
MPQLIEIAFKGNRKEFFLWESEDLPPRKAAVIVDADRGEDLGHVHAFGDEAERRSAKVPHGLFGVPPQRAVKRLATADDVRRHVELRDSDDDARRKAMDRVKANALVMKMTDAEWQWDRKKLTFYFTAEKRVDFRTLVRELASMFRTRIELKQIGVRDEAKRLDGIGRCGRQYCSASWLPELRPVNLGVAKDQRLSLNPSQISGACGRLMCCLRYEHDFYVHSRRKYPKEGKTVRTSKVEEKVIANDIFRERVTLRGIEGETRTISLIELRAELSAAGDPIAPALELAALEVPTVRPARDLDSDDAVDGDDVVGEELTVVQLPRERLDFRESRPPRTSGPRSTAPEGHAIIGAAPRTSGELAAEGEKRAQRRRGRRGGRRNRPSGGTTTADAGNDSPPIVENP